MPLLCLSTPYIPPPPNIHLSPQNIPVRLLVPALSLLEHPGKPLLTAALKTSITMADLLPTSCPRFPARLQRTGRKLTFYHTAFIHAKDLAQHVTCCFGVTVVASLGFTPLCVDTCWLTQVFISRSPARKCNQRAESTEPKREPESIRSLDVICSRTRSARAI